MDPRTLGRHDSWDGVRAVVAGFGVSGFAAADNLTHLGAARDRARRVRRRRSDQAEKAELLEVLGADSPARARARPRRCPTTSTCWSSRPGWRPDRAAAARRRGERGIPVWGEVELAWRLRDPDHPAPWLAVTGTNGKTTTVQMLDSILRAAGLRSVAAGNVGLPIVEAVMDPEPYDVLAVELSSFQLHYTDSMSAESAAVLNVAEDHLDWYAGRPAWRTTPPTRAGSTSGSSAPASTTSPTPRPSGWSARPTWSRAPARSASPSACPAVGMVGVVEDILADRAFIEEREHQRRRAVHARRPRLAGAALRRQRPRRGRPGPRARRLPGRGPRRAARLPPRRPPDRDRRRGRRGHLGRRLQGHQPARRPVLAPGLRPRGVGRRRPGQGRPLRRPGARRPRPAARRRAPRAGPARDRRGAFATRARCARHRGRRRRDWSRTWPPWSASWTRPPRWPDPATRCCSLRDAPPWTCSPTTPRAATPSPRRYAAGAGRRTEERGERSTTANPDSTGSITGRRRTGDAARSPARHVAAGTPPLRDALDRPLTSYYLLLGASALLLTIGADHGAQRLQRLLLRGQRRRLLRGRQAPADVGAIGAALRVDRLPAVRSAGSAGSPGPATSSRWCCSC